MAAILDDSKTKLLLETEKNLDRIKLQSEGSKLISEKLWAFHENKVVPHAIACYKRFKESLEKGQVISPEEYDMLIAHIGSPNFKQPKTFRRAIISLLSIMEKSKSGLNYGPAEGTIKARMLHAEGFSKRYGFPIDYTQIFLTLGGMHALKICFTIAKKLSRERKMEEPIFCAILPLYPVYKMDMYSNPNKIHGIDVTKLEGFRLTPKALREGLRNALKKAKSENSQVFFLLNIPHNPTGISYKADEIKAFADILLEKEFESINIIQDSAYFEQGYRVALENVAPLLFSSGRLINCESLTKSHSLAAQRSGLIITKNADFARLIPGHIQSVVVHHSILIQEASGMVIRDTKPEYFQQMRAYYFGIVHFVYSELEKLGLAIPDKKYNPISEEGKAFYVLANIKRFYNSPMPKKDGSGYDFDQLIQSDEDFAHACLIKANLS